MGAVNPAGPKWIYEVAKAGPRIKSGVRERENPYMPGLRIREDGWTVARTRTFLAALAQTGCVTDAARVAGISRKSVNDARIRFDEFDRACSTALARAARASGDCL